MLKEKFHNSIVLQQEQSDCGVACLLSIIKYYGGNSSIETIRKLSGTNITGTTLLGLYQAASSLGFKAEGFEADIAALFKHPSPTILHVLIEDKLEPSLQNTYLKLFIVRNGVNDYNILRDAMNRLVAKETGFDRGDF